MSTNASLAASVVPAAARRPSRSAWTALWRHRSAQVGGSLLLLILLAALFAPWLAPQDPLQVDTSMRLLAPSAAHWLGTDELGRDVASRIIYGARWFVGIGIATLLLSASLGVALGLIAAMGPRWADLAISALNNVLLSFPYVLLVLAVVAILGPNLVTAILAVSIGGVPGYARLVRGEVLRLRSAEYVEALVALGANRWQITRRAILPNISSPLIVYASFVTPLSVLAAASLSFLGLGVQPPAPEWGAMLVNARNLLRTAWWAACAPGLAIFIAIFSTNLLGNALRDVFDPRSQGR